MELYPTDRFFYTDFRRPSPPMPPNENSDTIQHIPVRLMSYLKNFLNQISLGQSTTHARCSSEYENAPSWC